MKPRVVIAAWAALQLSCVADRPIADEETDRSPTAKLFAADCRAWVRETGEIESQVLLVDFADGQGDLRIRWSIDGVEEPVRHESRPRVVREGGRFVKYSLKRNIVRRLPPGEHRIVATIENPPEWPVVRRLYWPHDRPGVALLAPRPNNELQRTRSAPVTAAAALAAELSVRQT